MATQVFAEEELRFFSLASADVTFVDPGRGRGSTDRLGLSVALCTLPWLGFVPDDVVAAPPVAVARLADQLGVDPDVLRTYACTGFIQTVAVRRLGWKVEPIFHRPSRRGR